MFDQWVLEDGFGRRWRLWLAPHGAPGGMPRESARAALEALVHSCLGRSHPHERHACSALFSIHDRLTCLSISGLSSNPVDAATR